VDAPGEDTARTPPTDSTTYIPRVEDYGGYPTVDPDAYVPRRGRFTEPGPDPDEAEPTEIVRPVNEFGGVNGRHSAEANGATAITDPVTDIRDLDTGEIRDRPPAPNRSRIPRDRPPMAPKETGRTVLRTAGEVLITLGMVVLLFVVYELYVTNIFSAQKQANATSALDKEWDTVQGAVGGGGQQRTNHYDLADGHGIAKLYIPSLGRDFHFTVIEGTTQPDLAIGPGHYPGTALPGEPGDMAIAGHRVGEGAPFDDLGLVQSCDAIVVETSTDWYVYRMLPMANEVADWATTKGKTSQCAGPDGEGRVTPLTGLYAKTVGQEIVLPTEGDVVAPVPHYPGTKLSDGQEISLLTLTTCNPKFSAAQRMIIHAVLVKDWKKNPATPDQSPPELKETT
jgi:sortase (surface protein transpeptidase)